MDAAYLKSTLGDLLSEGLSQTILQNPPDKITYLAHWLRASVVEKRKAAETKVLREQVAAEDQARAAAGKREEEKEAAAAASEAHTLNEREVAFTSFIEKADSVSTLLPGFLRSIRDLTGASSAYFGQLDTQVAKDSGEATRSVKYLAATPENEWLCEKRLPEKKGRNTFELFKEEEEEPEPEEDENGNPIPRPPKALRSVFIPNVLIGPKAASTHFFKQPSLGSYLGVRISYPQCVRDEVLDEAVEREAEIMQMKKEEDQQRAREEREAKEEAAREAGLDIEEEDEDAIEEEDEEEEEEEEEEDERSAKNRRGGSQKNKKDGKDSKSKDKKSASSSVVAPVAPVDDDLTPVEEDYLLTHLSTRVPVEYVLCLDTLGARDGMKSRLSEENVEKVKRYSEILQKKMIALDRASFTIQRKKRADLLTYNQSIQDMNEGGTLKTDEEKTEELERHSDELEASGRPMSEEDVIYKYRTELILTHLKKQISEWSEYEVMRGASAVVVLQATLSLLGYPLKCMQDSTGVADWTRMKKIFSSSAAAGAALDGKPAEDFFTALRDYDPRATSHDVLRKLNPEKLYTESIAVGKLIEGLDYEEVKAKNYALSELLLWTKDVLAVKRRAKLERAREAKRAKDAAEAAAEEARLAAEAAAEAAERAANGEDEEKEEGDDEDKPEDEEEEEQEEEEEDE